MFEVSIESKRNGNASCSPWVLKTPIVSIESKRNGNWCCDVEGNVVYVAFQSNLRGMETSRVDSCVGGISVFQSNLRGMETTVT